MPILAIHGRKRTFICSLVLVFGLMTALVNAEERSSDSELLTIGIHYSSSEEEQALIEQAIKRLYDNIYTRLGVDYQVVPVPFFRGVGQAGSGELDAMLVYEILPGVSVKGRLPEGLVVVPEMQSSVSLVLVALKSRRLPPLDTQAAKALKIGLQSPMAGYEEYLERNGYVYHGHGDYAGLYRLLQAGRIDAILITRYAHESLSALYRYSDFSEVVFQLGCLKSYMSYSSRSLGKARAQTYADEHGELLQELKQAGSDLLVQEC